jgi:hypothetical protein
MLAPYPSLLNVLLGMALFSVIAVSESYSFTVSALNVLAPIIDATAVFVNTTVEVPAEKVPSFVQFPKRTIFAEPPAHITICLACSSNGSRRAPSSAAWLLHQMLSSAVL